MAELKLIYEGTDITEYVDIMECVYRDTSGKECDCLNMKVDHAEKWMRWGPRKNDTIQAKRGGYDTKALYLNTITLEDGAYRIYATSVRSGMFAKKWQAYQNATLGNIMDVCASELGMGAACFGIDAGLKYEYMMRRNQTALAFLDQLGRLEGAVIKAVNGKITAIGIEYAQAIKAMHTIELSIDQADSAYTDRRDKALGSLRVDTPYGRAVARAKGTDGLEEGMTDLAVDDDAQAHRWAKGLLLAHNRACETLRIMSEFNPGYTALARVDIESASNAAGQWIIDDVEHDMVENTSRIKLLRCITNIA